jgi:transcriptional regulator with XRE-family HTH domain
VGADSHQSSALRAARVAAGLSQEKLAERVNAEIESATGKLGALDGNTISRLERGAIGRPARRTIDALCRVLGVDTETELGFDRPAVNVEAVRHDVAKPWKVGPDALDAIGTVLAGLRRLEDATNSRTVASSVDQQIAIVQKFAKDATHEHRQQAVALAAEASTYRGWLALDMRDWKTADRSLNDATALAYEGQTQNLLVEAVGFKSYAALKRGEIVAAVSLRHAAQPLAQSEVERAVASLHLARTLAIAGDFPASDKALALADKAIEAAQGVPRDDYHYYVTDPWLLIQHGLVHAWAGRKQQAASDIAAGLADMPAEQRESEWAAEYRKMLERVS